MGIVRHSRCAAIDWLTIGPIAPHADAIKQHFVDGRYASTTIASYLIDIAHFARWACSKRLDLLRIDEASVSDFLDQHLPNCRCEGSVRHDRCDHRAALGHESMNTTHRYVEANLAMKEKALARLEPPDTKLRRFRAPDALMRFLQAL